MNMPNQHQAHLSDMRGTTASMRTLGTTLIDTADSIESVLDEMEHMYNGFERFHRVADQETGEMFSPHAMERFRQMTPREFFESVEEGDLNGLSNRKVLQLLKVLDEKTQHISQEARTLSDHLTQHVRDIGRVMEMGATARARLVEEMGVKARMESGQGHGHALGTGAGMAITP